MVRASDKPQIKPVDWNFRHELGQATIYELVEGDIFVLNRVEARDVSLKKAVGPAHLAIAQSRSNLIVTRGHNLVHLRHVNLQGVAGYLKHRLGEDPEPRCHVRVHNRVC